MVSQRERTDGFHMVKIILEYSKMNITTPEMKLTVLVIALAMSMAANAGPVNAPTSEPLDYYHGNVKQPERDRRTERQGDLEPAEFHYPIIAIGYPIYGGYHGHHGKPWHHWHGGYGWRPQYGGQWHGGWHGGYPLRPQYGNWHGQWGGFGNNW